MTAARTPLLRYLPSVLRSFLLVLASVTGLCLLVEVIARYFLHLPYPYNWPLMFVHPSFVDFRWYVPHFKTFHTLDFFIGRDVIMYPAPVVVCYWFFYRFQPVETIVFLSFIVVSALTASVLALRALVRRGLAMPAASLLMGTTFLLAYPLWFEFKQGNMEIVVWVVLSLGLWAFIRDRNGIAATLFGVAAALKLFPFIYFVLLLSRRKYKDIAWGCLIIGAVFLCSFWFIGPTIADAIQGQSRGMHVLHVEFMAAIRPNEFGFDHSIFLPVKIFFGLIALLQHHKQTYEQKALQLAVYLPMVATAGAVLYFAKLRRLPMLNQIGAIVTLSILLPPVSFDYTMLHLYGPWLLLAMVAVDAEKRGEIIPALRPTLMLCGLCFAPLSEFIAAHERFGGQIRSFAMLVLVWQFSTKRFGNTALAANTDRMLAEAATAPPSVSPALATQPNEDRLAAYRSAASTSA